MIMETKDSYQIRARIEFGHKEISNETTIMKKMVWPRR